MNKYSLALLKVHGTAIFFGLSGVFGVLIESSSEALTLGRAIIAFAFIALYFLFKKRPLTKLTYQEKLMQFVMGGLLALHWISFYLGVKIGGVAVGTLGFASFPAFTALFEMLFFREKPRVRDFVLLIAISFGLILITPAFEFGNQVTQGLLWGIFSAFSYGVLAVMNRHSATKLSGVESSLWQYLAIMLILLPFYSGELFFASLSDWFWIGCIGVFCTTFAYTLYVSSLDTINARTAAMIISLEPVYAILVAWLWFDDVPSLKMVLGGALIIGAVAWANLKK
ncbi:RhaT protein [Bibersteinia trehalosi USDA-ARS-USMARC-188]|uniref:RhaT protein n=3 Tax=Bibersteinia trehalosi TaxID=47735 RepID=A0A4V7IBT6_BIBTR|nr:DMT family transporter [Bibersteinia trehalosi]AGH37686.1 RhaT protein [Bibersteinia trehalosi USDA-ARS-USMARC-192]AHG82505.1 RhaT protein [Bibersteinia trehalosi USDA-ARS-USMARC-188]AHG84839.1 RhaT protein [Bibersteinia trehalosi USDA-ARS-USMARC-189]RRN00348.1 DMT family transporter [Bibersteinia trehalosi]TCT15130.1 drug/metabolite transporter (DMT)-like permease [Bibersteinia trehalosi]